MGSVMYFTVGQLSESGPQGALALLILVAGFGGVLLWRWVRLRWAFRDRHSAVRHAIENADGRRTVTSAARMITAIRRAELGPEAEACLQPELGRLERAVERSSGCWTALKFDSVAERSEFATTLSAFIAKLRMKPVAGHRIAPAREPRLR